MAFHKTERKVGKSGRTNASHESSSRKNASGKSSIWNPERTIVVVGDNPEEITSESSSVVPPFPSFVLSFHRRKLDGFFSVATPNADKTFRDDLSNFRRHRRSQSGYEMKLRSIMKFTRFSKFILRYIYLYMEENKCILKKVSWQWDNIRSFGSNNFFPWYLGRRYQRKAMKDRFNDRVC